MRSMDTVLVTAYSKAPNGTAMYEVYKYVGVILEIDYHTHTIVNVEFTFLAELTKDYFKRLVTGYNLKNGLEPLILKIKQHYFAPSQQAVIVSLQSAVQRYWDQIDKME